MNNPIYDQEIAELQKLPRARLLAEAATARINMRGWMSATCRAWDIVERNGLRPQPMAETLDQAVERNLLFVAKLQREIRGPNVNAEPRPL